MTTPKKILLIEDEVNLRELVKARLEQNGYEVTVVGDGFQAIIQARRIKPDLIILDLMIPRLDGYTVCHTLKASSDLASVPIIMFTARSSPEDMRRGMDMGADAYVIKPFTPATLLVKIQELLQPRAPAEEQPTATPPAPSAISADEKAHAEQRELAEEESHKEAQARADAEERKQP